MHSFEIEDLIESLKKYHI